MLPYVFHMFHMFLVHVPVVLVNTIKSYVFLNIKTKRFMRKIFDIVHKQVQNPLTLFFYYYYMKNACYLSYVLGTSSLYEEKTVFLKISQTNDFT